MGSFGFGQGFFGMYALGGTPPVEVSAILVGGEMIVPFDDTTMDVPFDDTSMDVEPEA